MNNAVAIKNSWRIIATDIAVLVLVYFIPALTHLSTFPLYYLDPMRFLLFAAYLISKNQRNAFVLAATIPLFSSLVTQHPPFYKAILISVELVINIGLFQLIVKKVNWQPGLIIFLSAVISKVFYYAFKYIFIQFSVIEGELITTGLFTQLLTITGLSVLFALFYKKSNT